MFVVEWDPPKPEHFYQPTGYERTPMQAGEEKGKVVFCTDHGNIWCKKPFVCSVANYDLGFSCI